MRIQIEHDTISYQATERVFALTHDAFLLSVIPRLEIELEIARGNLEAIRLSHSVVRLTPEAIKAWMALPFDKRVKGGAK